MSYDIAIKVDPSGAEPAIAKVERALDKVEEAGADAGKAVSSGLQKAGTAADQAKGKVGGLAKMVEQISKSKIGNLADGLGLNLGMLTGAGAAMAGGALVKELIDLDVQRHDRMVRLENSMQKFEGTGRSMNGMMRDQIQLAKELRVTTDDTAAAYGAVGEATERLFLTQSQHVQLTKTLGQVMILNGKPLSEVEQIMGKLGYAMEAGVISGGEMKQLMSAFPDLAKIWTAELGMSRAELQKFGVEGSRDIEKLITSITKLDNATKIQGDFDKRKLTVDEKQKKVVDDIFNKPAQSTNQWANELIGLNKEGEKVLEMLFKMDDVLDVFSANSKRAAHEAEELAARVKAQNKEWSELWTNQTMLAQVSDTLSESIGKLAKKLGEGRERAAAFRDEMKQAYASLLDSIIGPQRDFTRDVGFLADMFAKGKISAAQYNEQLIKLRGTVAGLASMETPKGPVGAAKRGGVGLVLGMEENKATGFNPMSIADQGITGSAAMDLGALKLADAQNTLNAELAKTPSLLDNLKAGYDNIASSSDVLLNAFKGLEDQLVSFVTTGKASFSDLANSILADLTRMLAQKALMALFNALSGGGAGAGVGLVNAAAGGNFGGIAGAIFGGSNAFGGDYRVGGSGGPDSQRVMFNLSPGEHVRFTPPGRDPDAGPSSASQPVNLRVVNVTDPNELIGAMDSAAGEEIIVNVIRRKLPALRGALTGR